MGVYSKIVTTKVTKQTEPIFGREADMAKNNAGGYSFVVDDWTRLDRFLVIGSESPTFYVSEKKLTKENAANVLRCIQQDGRRVVQQAVSISVEGRAPKNDPAIFVLALAAAFGDGTTKQLAYEAVPKICRTASHLYSFAEASNALRGWGRGLRRAIGEWFTEKKPKDLAYQLIKYQQRDGWSSRDLLRLSHPKTTGVTNDILHWAVKGWEGVGPEPHPDESLRVIWAFEKAKRATTEQEVIALVRDYRLPRECIPTQWLNSVGVWEALLEEMPVTALVRNLGKMTSIGLIKPLSEASRLVVDKLSDVELLKKGRVHPLALLVAMKTYAQGHGDKGSLKWQPVQQIVDALDGGFYSAFKAVEPTNKRWLLALDVSGSMGSAFIGNLAGISARDASAAMALVTANVEKNHHFVGFTSSGWSDGRQSQWNGYRNGLTPLSISSRQRLTDAIKTVSGLPFRGTDCSLPMLYATANKLEVDAFVVFTDSETWAGSIQPVQALREYRQKTGIPAKLIVCGMVANQFTIADPNDAGMLDVVGFDTSVPAVMADFVRG